MCQKWLYGVLKFFSSFVFFVFILLSNASPAYASTIISFERIYTSNPDVTTFNSTSVKQSIYFTAQASKTVNSINIYKNAGLGSPGTFRIGLQLDSLGVPDGSWLTSNTFSPGIAAGSQTISGLSYAITQGTKYHIVILYESGTADGTNCWRTGMAAPKFETTSGVLVDTGSGYVENTSVEPYYILGYSDSTYEGQPYYKATANLLIGTTTTSGLAFKPSVDMMLTKVAFWIKKTGSPTDDLTINVRNTYYVTRPVTMYSATFATASQISTSYSWVEHTFSTPQPLYADQTYDIYLTRTGATGTYNYLAGYTNGTAGAASISWQGTNTGGFLDASVPPNVSADNRWDINVKLTYDTPNTVIRVWNVAVSKINSNNVTLVVETAGNTDVTVNYGLTAAYGSTASSNNNTNHEILISGLSPSTTYHYQLVVSETGKTTTTYADKSFKTQLDSGNSFSFIALSDSHITTFQGTTTLNIYDAIATSSADFVMGTHDILESCSASTDTEKSYYHTLFGLTGSFTDRIPFYPGMGNHDNPSNALCRGVYQQLFSIFSNGPDIDNDEVFYSFDYGDAHIVEYCQSCSSPTATTWLENDLAGSTKKWKIVDVSGIIPFTSTYPTSPYSITANTWQMFEDNDVALVLFHHLHTFYRMVKGKTVFIGVPASGTGVIGPYTLLNGDTGSMSTSDDESGYVKVDVSTNQITVTGYVNPYTQASTFGSFSLFPSAFELSSPENNSSSSNTSPTLSWNASSDDVSGLAKYQLYIDGQLDTDNINSGTTSITPTSALSNGNHTWYVKAVNNTGWSTQSTSTYTVNISPVSIFSPASAPGCNDSVPGVKAPWLNGAAAQSANSILLSFTKGTEPFDKYVLEYGTKSGNYQFSSSDIGNKETTSYLVKSLSPNTTYYFRIRAGNGCAVGPWSNELSARTQSPWTEAGQNLEIVASNLEPVSVPHEGEDKKGSNEGGYSLNIKVVDVNGKPIEGARVTIHSQVQEAVTDKEGVARFSNVEPGDHKIAISHQNYTGEESINLAGDGPEYNLNIQVKTQNPFLNPKVLGVIGVLLGIIVGMVVFIRAFKKTPDFRSGDELNAHMSSSFRGNRGLKSSKAVIKVKRRI